MTDPESSSRYISQVIITFHETWSKPSLPSWTSVIPGPPKRKLHLRSHRHRCAGSLPPVSKNFHRDRRSHRHFPSTPTRPRSPHSFQYPLWVAKQPMLSITEPKHIKAVTEPSGAPVNSTRCRRCCLPYND